MSDAVQVAEKGAECMSLLGLGDVVLPGLFIALILRFDENRKPGSRTYFYTVLVAYLIGLAATYIAMVWSEHAQPGNTRICLRTKRAQHRYNYCRLVAAHLLYRCESRSPFDCVGLLCCCDLLPVSVHSFALSRSFLHHHPVGGGGSAW